MDKLKEKGYKLGLISNCFSEEVKVIRESCLYPYFDAVVLSYEAGLLKPDRRIYELCVDKLGLSAQDCLYVGDGGSNELVGARECGMKAVQAGWYLKEFKEDYYIEGFECMDSPLQILEILYE